MSEVLDKLPTLGNNTVNPPPGLLLQGNNTVNLPPGLLFSKDIQDIQDIQVKKKSDFFFQFLSRCPLQSRDLKGHAREFPRAKMAVTD